MCSAPPLKAFFVKTPEPFWRVGRVCFVISDLVLVPAGVSWVSHPSPHLAFFPPFTPTFPGFDEPYMYFSQRRDSPRVACSSPNHDPPPSLHPLRPAFADNFPPPPCSPGLCRTRACRKPPVLASQNLAVFAGPTDPYPWRPFPGLYLVSGKLFFVEHPTLGGPLKMAHLNPQKVLSERPG